jgi:hypothetical protein
VGDEYIAGEGVMKMKGVIRVVVGGVGVFLLAAFLLAQLVPYGRDHVNPAVVAEPGWDSEETRALAVTACYDCHSNETIWPWYANVAPVSWMVQRHVDEGRQKLNFSEWGLGEELEEVSELGESVVEGEMPPAQYVLLHPAARLTMAERDGLVRGLSALASGGGLGGSVLPTLEEEEDD